MLIVKTLRALGDPNQSHLVHPPHSHRPRRSISAQPWAVSLWLSYLAGVPALSPAPEELCGIRGWTWPATPPCLGH